MRFEWYVVKYKNGVYVSNTPYAMSKSYAERLKELSDSISSDFSYEVKHREDLPK